MVSALSHRIPRARCYSGYCLVCRLFVYRTITLFGVAFQRTSTKTSESIPQSKPQSTEVPWFRLFLVRSPLLKESLIYFLFLWVLRCFSSPRLPPIYFVFIYRYLNIYSRWVSPFRFPWIYACLQLPMDYRSLPRLSSALGA